jgi:hypothetical protein
MLNVSRAVCRKKHFFNVVMLDVVMLSGVVPLSLPLAFLIERGKLHQCE